MIFIVKKKGGGHGKGNLHEFNTKNRLDNNNNIEGKDV
jgi:hypothetical protein